MGSCDARRRRTFRGRSTTVTISHLLASVATLKVERTDECTGIRRMPSSSPLTAAGYGLSHSLLLMENGYDTLSETCLLVLDVYPYNTCTYTVWTSMSRPLICTLRLGNILGQWVCGDRRELAK